jgi:ABC-type transport system involved in Fe-S cluster assembly fused permease/ATPase subunit
LLQFWLWQPLEYYSYDALNSAAHRHVMELSSDFHDSKETSYVNGAVMQGGGIRSLIDKLIFTLIPMFIDLFLVFAYLYYLFGPYMALTLAATTFFYLYTTAKLSDMSATRRRAYIVYYHKEFYSSYSSVENWRTASVSHG